MTQSQAQEGQIVHAGIEALPLFIGLLVEQFIVTYRSLEIYFDSKIIAIILIPFTFVAIKLNHGFAHVQDSLNQIHSKLRSLPMLNNLPWLVIITALFGSGLCFVWSRSFQ